MSGRCASGPRVGGPGVGGPCPSAEVLSGQRGFTLVELVVAIVIAALIAGFVGMFMATPVEEYYSQEYRGDLADSADSVARSFDQDVSMALPNSLRVTPNGQVWAVEMLATAGSARYWISGESMSGASKDLDFTAPDTQFATDGAFVPTPPAAGVQLAINNQSAAPGAYSPASGIMTPASTAIAITTVGGESTVRMTPGFQFAGGSTTSTVYVVTQAVAYICDQRAGTLTRYAGYAPAANATARDSAAKLLAAGPKTVSLVGRFIRVCRFAWTDGTPSHGGLLSVELTLVNPGNSLANNGGTLSLFHQVAVQGVP